MSAALTVIERGFLKGDLDANFKKILNLDTSNLGPFENQIPFADSEPLIRGSSDGTKLARFEVDGFSEETTRVFTLPNYNAQLASLAGAEDFTNKSYNGLILSADGSAELTIEDASVLIQGNVLLAGPFTLAGGFLTTLNVSGITDLDLPTSGTVATTDQLPVISDVAYNEATWNGNLDAATKNTIRDKFESLVSAPFSDATALVKGSANNLKMFRIEVDGLSTGTRVMTPPDYDFTPASIAGEESLIKKRINGLLVSVGDAASSGGVVTYDESPDFPFNLSLVAISQSGTSGVIRTTAPFDVVMPVSGTLAIVSETIALASLDTDKDLGAGLASDGKVPSQRATKQYVDAHSGAGIDEISGDSVASATSVDLSATTDYQLDVTGTDDIEQFILDEGDERVLVFDGDLTLIQGAGLLLPGSDNVKIAAGDYAIVRGKSGGVAAVSKIQKSSLAPSSTVADFDGGTIHQLGEFGLISGHSDGFEMLILRGTTAYTADRTLSIRLLDGDRTLTVGGTINFAAAFSTQAATQFLGAFAVNITATAATDVTLPAGTTTLAGLVGVPASAAAAGIAGQFSYDASFLYICTATNTWRRIAHNTW